MRHGNFHDKPIEGMHWQVIPMILPYLKEFRLRVFLAVMCLVAAKLASVSIPFMLKYIVDALDSPTKVALFSPLALVLVYGAARFFNVFINEVRDTLFGRVTERAIRRIGLKTFQHLHQLDLSFHLERRTGGLSRDIERGTTGINFLMRFMVFNILPTLFEVTLVVGLLFYHYGIIFAAITFFSVVAYVAFSVIATEWRTGFMREANAADSASNTRAVDSLLNFETVKYFTNEKYEAQCYDQGLATWEQAKRKNRLSLFALNGGQALIIAVAMTSMLAIAAHRVQAETMTIGDFVLINAFMMQLFIPLNFLGFVYREIKGSLANIEHMFDMLAIEPKITDKENADTLNNVKGRIVFDDVSFSYKGDRQILDRISFTIEPGQKVAVVGESGVGKSSLMKLLFRFYDIDQGSITIDGQDIRDVTQHSLRESIGVVPQDTVLFNTSIFENILYGRTDASKEEVMEAIRLAHLENFIKELPKGIETVVGERGLKLSGGEKQRVAIARTILKHPPILVFDEATSSLDSHSEQAILEALKELEKDYTSVVIAHRLSTIVDADNIIVMDKGQVAEQGTHQNLLTKKGLYEKLWQAQQEQLEDNH